MEQKRILLIDDDPDVIELLQLVFKGEEAKVYSAGSGREGLRLLWQVRPDLVILDIMMQDISGWEVCVRIRELTDVPVIFLTVLDQQKHVVRGLSLGADDYVSKPVDPSILLARAKALLRRRRLEQVGVKDYEDDHLRVNLEAKCVEVEGRPVKLTPTEYALFSLLVRNAGRITGMDQIQERVWGGPEQVSPQTIHVFISQLRKKIEPDPRDPRYIISEYGMGYRFL